MPARTLALILAISASSCASRASWSAPPKGAPDAHEARASAAARLEGPYAPEARRERVGSAVDIAVPASFPPPVKDMIGGASYYVDAKHSVIDPEKKAAVERAEAPLRAFGRVVMELSDGYLRSKPADTRLASATLEGLYQWASAGAMLGKGDRQGTYHLTWALGAYALDYLKVRDAAGLDPAKKAAVEGWLQKLAAEVIAYHADHPRWTDHQNNHRYWAAMAVAAAGVAAGDRAMFDWGIAQFDVFARAVRPDGILPLELERGSRALHYHLFATAPLVMLAEIAAANGVDLYARGDRALDRLVHRCLEGAANPAAFGALAGAEQVAIEPSDLAWIEIYNARFPREESAPWLRSRPLVSGFLGGNLTLAFGAP